MDPQYILQKNENFPVPDMAIILEIEPAQGIKRIQDQRHEHPNSFEDEVNLQKVAAIFAAMGQDYIERIDGSGTIDTIHHQVFAAVATVLARKTGEPAQG